MTDNETRDYARNTSSSGEPGRLAIPGPMGQPYYVPTSVVRDADGRFRSVRFRWSHAPLRAPGSDGVESPRGAAMGYRQGHAYTAADIRAAYEAGARDARENGGAPSDHVIERASDAYVKLVHPRVG